MNAPVLAVAAFSATSAVFGFVQNRGKLVGGPISTPKVLWLNYALIVFFVLPFWLWRGAPLSPAVSAVFGWVLLSFVLRAVIEFYLIYVTITWKCVYGIGHDWFTFLLAAGLRGVLSATAGAADAQALQFLTAYQLVLLVESYMAWAFSKLASPQDGVYFASDEEKFRRINNITKVAVTAGYAYLAYFLRQTQSWS